MIKTKAVIVTGALLGILFSIWILKGALSDKDIKWMAAALLYLAGILFSAWGMWHFNRLALRISLLLAVSSFGFGCYITHFRWTFWLWKEPTFADRVASVTVQNLGGILMLAFPIFWVVFFTRPKTSGLFVKSTE